MIRYVLFLAPFLFLLVGCGTDTPADNRVYHPIELPTDQVDENELFAALSPLMYSDVSDPAARAQNQIIVYAIDQKLDVRPTGSGLFLWIVDPGEGELLKYGSPAAAHYQGQLMNGTVFDSSYDRGEALEFRVGEMIHGWNEALQLLRPGAKAVLLMPPALGYADEGYRDLIPPDAILRYDLEILNQ
jgi:FKBP-type peptidyl-prolyl cis-trans isomerase